MKQKKGFTLIELLIVIGIIAILAAIIYVAIDPAKRLGEARDADRWSSVNAILNAVLKSTVDTGGNLPQEFDTQGVPVAIVAGTEYEIGTATTASTNCAATLQIDLSGLVDEYLASLPVDPDIPGTQANTGYSYSISSNGRITIAACAPEETASISVTR